MSKYVFAYSIANTKIITQRYRCFSYFVRRNFGGKVV